MSFSAAYIEALAENDHDCDFLKDYVDWRRELRAPTDEELWLDSTIHEWLRPYLDPHEPLTLSERSLDELPESQWTDAEKAMVASLDKVSEASRAIPDPWSWLAQALTKTGIRSDRFCRTSYLHCHAAKPYFSLRPDLPFDTLVRHARRHQLRGNPYRAVVFYSRALQSTFPHTDPGVMLEAQDATQALGMWDGRILYWGVDTFVYRALRTNRLPDDVLGDPQQQLLAFGTMLLLRASQVAFLWDTVSWKMETTMLFFSYKIVVAKVLTGDLNPEERYYAWLAVACSCQALVASTLHSPYREEHTSDHRVQDYCTQLLLFLANTIATADTTTWDDTATQFLKCRIAKAIKAIQPYLDLAVCPKSSDWPNPFPIDAIVALSLKKSETPRGDTKGDFSSSSSLGRVIGLLNRPEKTTPMTNQLARVFAEYIDDLVESNDVGRMDEILSVLRLIQLESVPVNDKVRKVFWETHRRCSWQFQAMLDSMMCHPRVVYNMVNYREFKSARNVAPKSATSTPPRNLQTSHCKTQPDRGSALDRIRFDFHVPPPDCKDALLVQYSRYTFQDALGWTTENIVFPPYMNKLFFPYLFEHFSSAQYHNRYWYLVRNSDERDDDKSWETMRHSIGLGRTTLTGDSMSRKHQLELEIDVLRLLKAEFAQLSISHGDNSQVVQHALAFLEVFMGEAFVELAEVSDDRRFCLSQAAESFQTTKATTAQQPHTILEGMALTGLLDIQADAWRRGWGETRPDDVLHTCLEVEIAMRRRCFFIDKRTLMQAGQRWQGWQTAVMRSLQPIYDWRSKGEHVYAIAREVCLSQNKPLEAFCWVQRGKANVTSGLITQHQSFARLLSWLDGTRRPEDSLSLDLTRKWETFLASRGEDSFTFKPTIRGLEDIQRELDEEITQLTAEFGPRNTGSLTIPLMPVQGRIVWVDWSLDKAADAYWICIASIPGVPQFIKLSIRRSEVKKWLITRWSQPETVLRETEFASHLRFLDGLVSPLNDHLHDNDVLILCPTAELHSLPLHALYLRDEMPLIACHPVVYVPNFPVFSHCSRNASGSPSSSVSPSLAITSVYHPLGGVKAGQSFCNIQRGMKQALQDLATDIGADFYWDQAVTRDTMVEQLQSRPVLFFIGHCIAADQEEQGLRSHLVLGQHDLLYTSDFFQLDMPHSLLVLLGCGTSEHNIRDADELMSVVIGAMVGGASSVLGTLWSVDVRPAVAFARNLGQILKGDDLLVGDGGMIDLARAVQKSVLQLREIHPQPIDWAAYALHGSPVMRDIWSRTGDAQVGDHED